MAEVAFGIDIGGTGIKGAPVDVATGELAAERCRLLTPHPATPDAVIEVTRQVVAHFAGGDGPGFDGAVGCTFPAVVQHGVVRTAANVDDQWVGVDAGSRFSAALDRPTVVLNDADAAGIAEMRFGAGRDRRGTIVIVTLGTGIGTAVFADGVLVPNTELGHLTIRGKEAETRASELARERKGLSWGEWAARVDEFLGELERLLWPDRFVIGGGVSKKFDKFAPHLHRRCEVVPAELRNEAGIVGAALAAVDGRAE